MEKRSWLDLYESGTVIVLATFFALFLLAFVAGYVSGAGL